MNNIIIQRKSQLQFTFSPVNSSICTINTDQQYALQYFPSGTQNNIICSTPGRFQSIPSGSVVNQNTNWGGFANAFWQQNDWYSPSLYPYAGYSTPYVFMYGCVMNSSCISGHPVKHNIANPGIDLVQLSSSPTAMTARLEWGSWGAGVLLPYDATLKLWEEIGGVWVELASTICPNGHFSGGGYNPTFNITYGVADVGVHHYKCTFETHYPNPSYGNFSGWADMYVQIGSNSYDLPNPKTNEHNFITFNGSAPTTCIADRNVCYPIVDMTDLQFQMTIDTGETGCYGNFPHPILGDGITAGTQIYLCVSEDCNIPTPIATAPDFLNSVAKLDNWDPIIGTNIFVNQDINWSDVNSYLFANMASDACFKILLCKREPEGTPGEWIDTVIGCSDDCFELISDDCFTSIIRYSSNNDELCYYYSQGGWTNQIRLAMYPRNVQYPSSQSGYQLSNGTWLKITERIQEEWDLETDWMDAKKHKALKFALAHDTINIISNTSNFAGQVICQQPYNIKWETKPRPYPLAKGSTKITKTINTCSVNTNC